MGRKKSQNLIEQMNFPHGYVLALNDAAIEEHFPNLINEQNFEIKSLLTEDYNCIAWVQEIDDDWIQIVEPDGKLVFAAKRYLDYFKNLGYVETPNKELESGVSKIAIYIDTSTDRFKHVAKQMEDGRWKSKLGDWEDIEHDVAETLIGKSYGDKIIYLLRNV